MNEIKSLNGHPIADVALREEVNGLKDQLIEIDSAVLKRRFAEKVMLYYGYPNAINNSWDVNNSANMDSSSRSRV